MSYMSLPWSSSLSIGAESWIYIFTYCSGSIEGGGLAPSVSEFPPIPIQTFPLTRTWIQSSKPEFRMTRFLASKIAFSLSLFSLIAPLLTLPRPRPSRPQVSPIAASATKRNPSYAVFKLTSEHLEVSVQYPFCLVRTVTCDMAAKAIFEFWLLLWGVVKKRIFYGQAIWRF